MLEYLKYYRGGYFGPNERLIIEKHGSEYSMDYVKYYQGYIENGIPFFHADWPEARFQRWLDKLEATGFTRLQGSLSGRTSTMKTPVTASSGQFNTST